MTLLPSGPTWHSVPILIRWPRAMSSTTPTAAPPFKKGRKPEKPELMTEPAQATNEELRGKLTDAQVELQQERGKVRRRWRRRRRRRRLTQKGTNPG